MEDAEKVVAYWREHAQYDLDTAESLFETYMRKTKELFIWLAA